ncbi:Gfo/Idh/MocA family oxidoreductase [Microbispora hainanensis]|jgi:virulence factor|uniref:Gfo/Idh/MocA family oxidoreductase n=1 Tax=Microbispora hainanensis TaxID=568844 RepID=A0ABZ1SR55_9ACTN|nr:MULTISPECIES: Gfo/Idh/MocA family oxidoreductase [Microbispora]NJP27396.1 Gfo/Idh/MocA family oxidoreductase [Microbispora sp. CL1-1]TQS11185.1 Gfo/Idh/MocA family oxidoreductase [Microbispora sp. SCL1-1]
MRVGIIGLGDIAEKAYLPVLAATPGIEPLLCTRDRATLDRLGDAYRIGARFTSVDALAEAGIDAAFVHAATGAHVPIVTTLLEAGVHVYVDKPLAYDAASSAGLVRLARERNRSLMVGFNRRHAPAYAALRGLPRDVIVMQKNRRDLPGDPRTVIFDDFVHVADTLRFLAPGPVTDTVIRTRLRDGLLEHVVLTLGGDDFTAVGVMSRTSGAAEETCEVMGGGGKRRVVNLGDVVEFAGDETLTRRGDWVPATRQRGIEQVCREFLDAVREGRVLDAADALETHELCEQIVLAATKTVETA